MAFAELELPYIPSRFARATEASRAFPQSRADSAGSLLANIIPAIVLSTALFHWLRRHAWTQSSNKDPAMSRIAFLDADVHSFVVAAPYGLTDTTASSSVDGWCREVTVTHSPGFTALIAATALSGTLMRIVRY